MAKTHPVSFGLTSPTFSFSPKTEAVVLGSSGKSFKANPLASFTANALRSFKAKEIASFEAKQK